MNSRKRNGFTLIELLIVVAIILIIAAIAIPNFVRGRIAANEASAVASLRAINTAEATYNYTYAAYGDIHQLGPNANPCVTPTVAGACLIDKQLSVASTATTAKSGYFFSVIPDTVHNLFTAEAEPANVGTTGNRGFCSDQNLVLFSVSPGGDMGACITTTATQL